MRNYFKNNLTLKVTTIITAVVLLSYHALGYPAEMRQAALKGPWEITVGSGQEAVGMSFVVSVPDENKPAKLSQAFPIMETPIKVRLEQYIPDLQWETKI